MKKKLLILMVVVTSFTLLFSCKNKTTGPSSNITTPKVVYENPNYTKYIDTTDIKTDVDSLKSIYRGVNSKTFSKYIQYITASGKPITILASDKITDEMLLNSYSILSFYLANFGEYDKTKLANTIANTKSLIVMPNGADGERQGVKASRYGQPVYQNEAVNIGSNWYINNNYEHRDASFEEIFHFVHDYGIGTKSNPGNLPELQKKIDEATSKALPSKKSDWGLKGYWGLNSKEWLTELKKEGSLEQEYIVSVIDTYYGMWEAWTEGNGGMWDIYSYKTRQLEKENDTKGYKIINDFLGPNLTFMARVDPNFSGTFIMSLDKNHPYTYKSQYLQNLRLIGVNNNSIIANDLDNILIPNSGNNSIDGKEGNDIVQFSGKSTEYSIDINNKITIVTDSKKRDGMNSLTNIDILRFTDLDVKIN